MRASNTQDRFTVFMSRRVVRQLFRRSTEAHSLAEHVAAVGVPTLPTLIGSHEVESLIGPLRTTISVVQDPPDAEVTILWHAGVGERNPDRAVSGLLQLDRPLPARVISVLPPFHDTTARDALRSTEDLEQWQAMSAASIGLIEALRLAQSNPVIVLGYSLGGYVTLGHLVHYETADRYAPIACGQRLGTVMSEVHIGSRLTDSARAQVIAGLDLNADLSAHVGTTLFPVQCDRDLISPAAIQGRSYGGPVTTWPVAHLSSRRLLGRHGRPFIEGLIASLR